MTIANTQPLEELKEKMSFKKMILKETPDYFIIHKPAGISVHGDGRSAETTLSDLILQDFPEMVGIGEPELYIIAGVETKVLRPGIVHRLDKETSGVMVVAKTQNFFEYIKKQFQTHGVKKVYHAFVEGTMKATRGVVSAPIGRHKQDVRRFHAGRGTVGELREAETIYRVLDNFTDENGFKYSYLECAPKTGRTHQIRVHMKYLQHSLIGDNLYNTARNKFALGFRRTALHAFRISFYDFSSNLVTYEAPHDADFAAAIAKYVKI